MKQKSSQGFTLIEVMIVVAIVAILAAIAVPNYSRYVERGRRAEARELLMRVAAAEERYYTNFNRYTDNITGPAPAGLGLLDLRGEFYNITAELVGGNNQTYVLRAITPPIFPVGHPNAGKPNPQAKDKCGQLNINNAGIKGRLGTDTNGRCW